MRSSTAALPETWSRPLSKTTSSARCGSAYLAATRSPVRMELTTASAACTFVSAMVGVPLSFRECWDVRAADPTAAPGAGQGIAPGDPVVKRALQMADCDGFDTWVPLP